MKKLADFLDDAKAKTGSDYRTAQLLKMTRSGVSNARKSGSMDVDNCVELAKILEIDPAEIIAACHVARHPEARAYWQKWVAATVILSAGAIDFFSGNSMGYELSLSLPAIYYAHIRIW